MQGSWIMSMVWAVVAVIVGLVVYHLIFGRK